MNINQIVLPINVITEISPNNSVTILYSITEKLDYILLNLQIPSYHNILYSPKLLFQILVLAYSKQTYSSRRLEEACIDKISFK